MNGNGGRYNFDGRNYWLKFKRKTKRLKTSFQ